MSRAADLTRQALLDAGRAEFAAAGVAGARVDAIAARAGVNKERIYGHFGSKDGLFDAVLDRALDEAASAVPISDVDDLGEYVARIYDFHRAHPQTIRLLLWDALQRDESDIDPARQAYYDKKTSDLADRLHTVRGPHTGRLLLTLLGLGVWPHVRPQMARMILRDDADDADAMRDHLVDVARSVVGEQPAPP